MVTKPWPRQVAVKAKARRHGNVAKAKSCILPRLRQPHGHAAKAKVAPRPCYQCMHATKANAAPMGMLPWHSCCQGEGSPMGIQPRPRHVATTKACSHDQASPHGHAVGPKPRHATTKAKVAPCGHTAKDKTCSQGQGSPMGMLPWHACCQGEGSPIGTQPRPRHAAMAKLALMGMLLGQGQGMQLPRPRQPPMGMQLRTRHAAKTKAATCTRCRGRRGSVQ